MDNHTKIINQQYKGDKSAEIALNNKSTISLQIQVDLLFSVLSDEQKALYNQKVADWKEFIDDIRTKSLADYTQKRHLLGKTTIFEDVSAIRTLEEQGESEKEQ